MKMEFERRAIHFVVTAGESGEFWRVGMRGITKIMQYFESGQMARVPWLAVYKGNVIIARVNCAAVEYITYQDQDED